MAAQALTVLLLVVVIMVLLTYRNWLREVTERRDRGAEPTRRIERGN